MRRLVLALALVAVSALVAGGPPRVGASVTPTDTTQVVVSCTDGHSVVLWVDSSELTSLVTEIQAINSTGTTSCSLNTSASDPSSETTEWTVYDYNPSNRELAPRNSPNSLPATTPDNGVTWQFPFKPDIYTALFTTTDPTVTGTLSSKTLNDTITVTGTAATFKTQYGCSGTKPAAVRFYFTAPSASGSSVGTPPAGFYTKFWWSNPVNLPLITGKQSGNITASMSSLATWSDWNGKPASTPAVTEAFVEATQHVQSIGLSFGGECFFETGVTPTPDTFTSETFMSKFSES